MILTLEETKSFLKVDYDDEDEYIEELINASEQYLKNATGKEYDSTSFLAKLYCKILISDWYDNREYMEENKISKRVRFTMQSILQQLKYCDGD
ncbi:phage gp6-like head-tail connector protein [Anaerosalibacter bizertensis]|uniref:Phage gp6-like head-tail connector protein n=1 Tax=Anaerosalibacter bizertensis TaxID=932217 RepID=A0A844FGS2_9FIRM|nr:head-tail connector protein [Anaerosalibacter bizertensis]MSS43160.1 phage gp6-like head-tail connector protein [Anaerosalibacter bizertensis]